MRPDYDLPARAIFRAHRHTIQSGQDLLLLLEQAVADADKARGRDLGNVQVVMAVFDDNKVQIIATYGTFEELFPHFVNHGCMSYFVRYDSLD